MLAGTFLQKQRIYTGVHAALDLKNYDGSGTEWKWVLKGNEEGGKGKKKPISKNIMMTFHDQRTMTNTLLSFSWKYKIAMEGM